MPETGGYLDRVYDVDTPEAMRVFYDDWAETYDAELAANGFGSPARVAAALARFSPDRDAPVLDFACGTGLSGAALVQEGFGCIDGVDISEGMLAQARRKGIYRRLWRMEPGGAIGAEPGAHAAITAVAAISPGAAPADLIAPLIELLPRGGLFALTLNDYAIEQGYLAPIDEAVARGECELLMRERGGHFPTIGLGSTVLVLRRL